jgi:hypothetical protein
MKQFIVILSIFWAAQSIAQTTMSSANGAKIVINSGTIVRIEGSLSNTGTGSQIVNNGDLRVSGNFSQINGATYVGSGVGFLEFNGTSEQTISGDAPITITRMKINGTVGLKLTQALNIPTDLNLTSGDLDLNGKNVDLGDFGILSEDRANNHLVKETTTGLSESNKGGYIRVTNRATTGTLTEVAGLGIHLASAGAVSIDRYHYEGAGIVGGGVLKNYEITGTPTTATMRIEFASDELGGITPDNSFKLFRYDGATWTNQGGTWTDAVVDYVQLSGITAFSPWTAGSNSAPLPITLSKFEAQRLDNQLIMLKWQTLSEINNRGFEVEQSNDGQYFQKVGWVDGAGSSSSTKNYQWVITNENAAYYRLKQTDLDDKFTYSPIRFVGASEQLGLQVCPNPATIRVSLKFEQAANQEVLHLGLYNAQGSLIWEGRGKLQELENALNQQLPQQANGLLYLRLRSQVGVFEQKMLKF